MANTVAKTTKTAFRKTFKEACGKRVLAHLYEHLYGTISIYPENNDSHLLAFNAGKHWALMHIVDQLSENAEEIRKIWEDYSKENIKIRGIDERSTRNSGNDGVGP